jgi:E3 ubiquitin-protein ligase RNF14
VLRGAAPADGDGCTGGGSGSSATSGGSAASSDDGASCSEPAAEGDGPAAASQPEDDGELLLAMLCQPRPEGAGLLRAEVLAEVNPPPGGLQLTLGMDGGGAGADGGGSSSSSSAAVRGMPVGEAVRWLPPLRASFELPAGYPSLEPPRARLDAGWLRPAQLRALEAGLLEVWEAQGGAEAGSPVLFAFLEWLREEALERLGITDALRVCGGGGAAASCEAAEEHGSGGSGSGAKQESPAKAAGAARGHSAEQMVAQLLMFHASKEQEEFEAAQHTCGVCLENLPGSACIRLPGCRHFYCRGCLQGLCATHVKEGSFDALRCAAAASCCTTHMHAVPRCSAHAC